MELAVIIDFELLKRHKKAMFIVSGYDIGKVREHVSLAIGSHGMFCLIHDLDAAAVKAAVHQKRHPVVVMEPGAAARLERFGMEGTVYPIWIRSATGSVSQSGWPSVITDDSTVPSKVFEAAESEGAWFTRLKISTVMEEKAASIAS